MTWLTENWFWILTFIAFIAMHMFGHGGHGGHGRHGGGDRRPAANASETEASQTRASSKKPGGHAH